MATTTDRAAYLRLIGIAALIGIPAALVAALFLAFVHWLEDAMWPANPAWYLLLALPTAGAVIVLIARRLLPGDGGEEPLQGLSAAPTPISHAPGIALAAVGTLAFGAVLGPEAPVIALGSVVGMSAAALTGAQGERKAMLSTAGSFSAISALFGGPLVASMLLVESALGMGAKLVPALLPGLVASAVGYLIFIGFGDWGGLDAPGLVVPDLPPYHGTHLLDLLVALAVGVSTALLIHAVRRFAKRLVALSIAMTPALLAGGLAVGALALAADALGTNSQDVLFSGQAAVPAVVMADSTKVIVVLLVAKAIAYAISLSCGFRGGPIFPAILLGVALGSLPDVWFGVSPALAVAVGAAAGMAAQTRLLFAPVLFASLLVGAPDLDTTPAAVLATVAAWLTMNVVEPREGHPA